MKLTVLTFVAYYLPGFKSGGPVRSIANIVEHLGDKIDFRIVTADRDLMDIEPYPNITVNDWNINGKAQVFYASPGNRTVHRFAQLILETPHDALYLNSFFDPVFTFKPLVSRALRLIPERPIFIAPRGEFSEKALKLKAWKKRPYIWITRALGFYRNVTWQASSENETEDIHLVLGRTAEHVVVAPNLPSQLAEEAIEKCVHELVGPMKIVFLSRITPKKNLVFALRVLTQVNVPVEFTIYGPIEDRAYWQRCQNIIVGFRSHIIIRYGGVIPHPKVLNILAKHDLFFLPTLGENYGHVIYEALVAGLQVLISDKTPWRNLQELGVGWDLPLDEPGAFARVIAAQAKLNVKERKKQRAKAKRYAAQVAQDEERIAQNLALFTESLGTKRTQ